MFDKSNILFSKNKILKYDKIADDKEMEHTIMAYLYYQKKF